MKMSWKMTLPQQNNYYFIEENFPFEDMIHLHTIFILKGVGVNDLDY